MGAFVQKMLGVDFVEAVELSNDPRYLMGVLPAANLIATADELCQFYQMLLEGGTLGGKRLFEARTVWRATSEQSYGELDFTLGVPLRYGMGFMLGGEYVSLYGYDSRHAFGHLGLTNIVAWADPQRHLFEQRSADDSGAVPSPGFARDGIQNEHRLPRAHRVARAEIRLTTEARRGQCPRPPHSRSHRVRDFSRRNGGNGDERGRRLWLEGPLLAGAVGRSSGRSC